MTKLIDQRTTTGLGEGTTVDAVEVKRRHLSRVSIEVTAQDVPHRLPDVRKRELRMVARAGMRLVADVIVDKSDLNDPIPTIDQHAKEAAIELVKQLREICEATEIELRRQGLMS